MAAHKPSTESKRAETSRTNGAKSRGPRTEEGKAKSSQNALKHGLTAAKHLRLPDDDENAYEQFREAALLDLSPLGFMQTYHAERAIDCMWRLRRIPALEANLLHAETQPHHAKRTCYNFSHNDWTLAHLHICRYEATLERALKNALAELRKLQNEPSRFPEEATQSNAEPSKAMQSHCPPAQLSPSRPGGAHRHQSPESNVPSNFDPQNEPNNRRHSNRQPSAAIGSNGSAPQKDKTNPKLTNRRATNKPVAHDRTNGCNIRR